MNKWISLLLCAMLCVSPVLNAAVAESGAAINPYTISALDAVINLPGDVKVVSEQETENGYIMTLSLDGRPDCGYSIGITYDERYDEYFTGNLPPEMLQEILDYYAKEYQCETAPYLMQIDEEERAFDVINFFGQGSDGNYYFVFVYVISGYVFTVSCGTAAKQLDEKSAGTVYNLYWQVLEMLQQTSE